MSWSWGAEEDEVLDYLPHATQVLYLRVLRRRMDFATGVVGIACRISYPLIGEWLEVRPPRGSKNPVVRLSVAEIRSALSQLEKVGLIVRVRDDNGDALPLVFSLPFARTDLLRPKEEQQDEQQQILRGTTANVNTHEQYVDELFNSINSGAYGAKVLVHKSVKKGEKTGRNNSKIVEEQQEEQHTSGMSTSCYSLSLNKINKNLRGNNARIPDDWMPNDVTRLRISRELGLPINFVEVKAREIRMFWKMDQVVAYDWDKYFYGYCKNKLADGDAEFTTARRLLLEEHSSGGDHAG